MGNNFNIPIKVKVDTKRIGKFIGCSEYAIDGVINSIFGEEGLIRPNYYTSFRFGSYRVRIRVK